MIRIAGKGQARILMRKRVGIRIFTAAGSSLVVFLFLVYNIINPEPFRFETKKESVIFNAVNFLLQSKNVETNVPRYFRQKYKNIPNEFIQENPDCCQVWVFYRGFAPNKYLQEHSIINLSDKLGTFLNFETYLVRVTMNNGKNVVRADLQVSARGKIQEYWFNSEDKDR